MLIAVMISSFSKTCKDISAILQINVDKLLNSSWVVSYIDTHIIYVTYKLIIYKKQKKEEMFTNTFTFLYKKCTLTFI